VVDGFGEGTLSGNGKEGNLAEGERVGLGSSFEGN